MRIIIAGGPGTGKSTLGRELVTQNTPNLIANPHAEIKPAIRLLCADPVSMGGDSTCEDWEANSVQVATWFNEPEPWIVEGVKTVYALRKWLRMKAGEDVLSDDVAARPLILPPCDKLIVISRRHPRSGPPSKGHIRMRDSMHRKLDQLLERWAPLARVTEWR